MAFLKLREAYFDEHEWINNAQAREITQKAERSIKHFLHNLVDKNVLESQGVNKNRQ